MDPVLSHLPWQRYAGPGNETLMPTGRTRCQVGEDEKLVGWTPLRRMPLCAWVLHSGFAFAALRPTGSIPFNVDSLLSSCWLVAVSARPPLAYTLTQRICLGLTARERDEAEHGRPTGRIVMSPYGGFSEITEPVRPAQEDGPGPNLPVAGDVATDCSKTALRPARR